MIGKRVAYYMGREKAAISCTLDTTVLQFFSGQNRSEAINRILRDHIRAKLGDKLPERVTNRTIFARALYCVQKQFGHDHIYSLVMTKMLDEIEEDVE